ncbi:mechanosensitive ion channel family protein [Pseudomonas psychrophila]|uniref:Small-conductance mechanosensitive channel n=1 Tax=Pseudomonas psychrophila TaxID=122355 RepID=A0ABY0VRU1_9PSED|nr:mechanosensitive ion channel family protein [Pseudomonas psychrophila]KAB0488979.1 mechanosensitive ion channel [Pseudomonas psychrophila]KMN02367.1 mechanosensitive ion channel protein MscS [Pseudomonas psychrophila]QIE32667.1 mechanosensitive ion channel [Pseudomonas psychrophila]WVI99217.1 mechanosensitive ion channel family protein [Pseudomonas psychrophila]SDU51695.1 Small-conductance mechanosensitive channel [Pseudomonas psychrophila]
MSFLLDHPLSWAAVLLVIDAALWHLAPFRQRVTRVGVRLALFAVFSTIIINAGISPLQAPLFSDDRVALLGATALGIVWWLYAARVLTEVIGLVLMRRIGHSGRLLQDVIGALVFLAAIVAAAGYVLELPVKGLLATSGVVAIVVGLALQSTLSDVFSGIVLNTTKPYQVDDWIVIDGVEGKVLDIDWRATHLLTSAGSTAVVPNSVAAKAKIVNLSRPTHLHGVSISIQVPNHVRPRRVLDALERTLQGSSSLLLNPAPKAVLKEAGETMSEYVASGFIAELAKKSEVRNQLFDLAHRHLEAAGISRQPDAVIEPAGRARALLDEVKIFRSLSEEERDQIAHSMVAQQYAAGQVVLALDEVPDSLMVIATGVVSVTVPDEAGPVEAGRMGPGEIMGEESILTDSPSQATFTTLTSSIIYRLDKSVTRECMAQRTEVGRALNRLQAVREQSSRMALMAAPAPAIKGGFLSWLHRR